MIQSGVVLGGVYEVQQQIGAGGGGTIFLAYDRNLRMPVAIKKIHESGAYDLNEARRETDILKRLRHTYLPRVFNILFLDSGVYTVMDFIPGKSLEQLLQSGERFTEKQIVKYGTQLCEALAYLHAQKPAIIHGDIKPANIMITPEDNICLIDFNISAREDSSHNAYVMGYSPGYAAPEQYDAYCQIRKQLEEGNASGGTGQRSSGNGVLGETAALPLGGSGATRTLTLVTNQAPQIKGIPISTRSDVYSVGATLYRLLTGQKVSEGGDSVRVEASDGLCMILNRALSVSPAKRYRDAGKMLEAFRGVYKLDKAYRRVTRRQQMAQLFFVLLAAAGVVLVFLGRNRLRREGRDQYAAYIEELASDRERNLESEFSEIYAAAVELEPNELDAYYQKALYLYQLKDYEQGISYIENTVLANGLLYQDAQIAEIYELLGREYYELGEYEAAGNAYRNAIRHAPREGEYYVECAIAMAGNGDLAGAQEQLSQAVELGIGTDRVDLTNGEIARARGNNEEAIAYFADCLTETQDDYVRMRAYIFSSDAYNAMEPDEANYREQIALLERARTQLPLEYQPIVLQELGRAYINLNTLTEDSGAARSAIEIYQEIASSGYAGFTIYSNIVVLYERLGDFGSAAAVLDAIEDDYSDYYGYYKRRAYLEVELQGERENADRDYGAFAEYCKKARELYERSGRPLGQSNP